MRCSRLRKARRAQEGVDDDLAALKLSSAAARAAAKHPREAA
jgi:hypothetical protein